MVIGVELASGEVFEWFVVDMPRKWKSYVMRRCPYGVAFQGCRFYRRAVGS